MKSVHLLSEWTLYYRSDTKTFIRNVLKASEVPYVTEGWYNHCICEGRVLHIQHFSLFVKKWNFQGEEF